MEIIFDNNKCEKPEVSFILLDWSCRESFHMFHYLDRQTVPRDRYEVIWIEYYGRRSPELTAILAECEKSGSPPSLDKWIVLDIPDNVYYHKHLMYNVGIVVSRGRIVTICDSDVMVRPTLVESIINAFDRNKNPDYDPQSGIALHLDEVRSVSRKYYPFNFPAFEDIEKNECINWKNNTTTGLLEKENPIHVLNYGACMCALREDLIALGGADEHRDYLGHVCGPYELTFRLVNAGKKEIWHQKEFLYHTWHPGTDGYNNFLGPHDGKNMSTTALDIKKNGRIMPLLENPAIRSLRTKEEIATGESLLALSVQAELVKSWTISETQMLISLGKSAFNRADYDMAINYWDKVLGNLPNNSEIQSELGWAHYFKKNYGESTKIFDEIIKLKPSNHCALRGRGWSLLHEKRYEEAIQDFTQAVENTNSFDKNECEEIFRGRAWANYHAERFSEALEDFLKALENINPQDKKLLRNLSQGLAMACARTGALDHAVARFERILGNLPPLLRSAVEDILKGGENTLILKETLLSELGWAHYLKSDYGEALKVFDEALRLNPTNFRALSGRGWALSQEKRYEEAIQDFTHAVESKNSLDKDECEEIFRGRAWANFHAGRFSDALEDFPKALENLNPQSKELLRNLSQGMVMACARTGGLNQAVARFESILDNLPPLLRSALEDILKGRENSLALKETLLSELGWAHYLKSDYAEALRAFDEAIKLNPDNCRALCGRGWSNIHRRRTGESLIDFNKTIENTNPEDKNGLQEALRGRGQVLYLLGHYHEAISDFDKAMEYTDKTYIGTLRQIRLLRSKAYYQANMEKEALEDLKKAKENLPDSPFALKICLRLIVYGSAIKQRIRQFFYLMSQLKKLLNDRCSVDK